MDEAIANLRYGSICVNAPSIVGFCITKLTWGGFPGTTAKVPASGIGKPCCALTARHAHAESVAAGLVAGRRQRKLRRAQLLYV